MDIFEPLPIIGNNQLAIVYFLSVKISSTSFMQYDIYVVNFNQFWNPVYLFISKLLVYYPRPFMNKILQNTNICQKKFKDKKGRRKKFHKTTRY